MADPVAAPIQAQVVILDWNDLSNSSGADSGLIEASLDQAYGSTGTGILAIRSVPGFVQAKQKLFSLAHGLASLPNEYLETKLTDKESLYNAGWSFGKEKLGDTPDTSKASFYFNPIADEAGTVDDRIHYPLSYPKNIWPTDRLPALEPAAKELGCLLARVATEVGRHVDGHAKRHFPDYSNHYLYDSMKDTDKVKGRLLYYYPLQANEGGAAKEDSW